MGVAKEAEPREAQAEVANSRAARASFETVERRRMIEVGICFIEEAKIAKRTGTADGTE